MAFQYKIKKMATVVTNIALNYTDLEMKVIKATNNESWGPTGMEKKIFSKASYSPEACNELSRMIFKRLKENKRNKRIVQKCLLLIHHLLLNGSESFVEYVKEQEHTMEKISKTHFIKTSENNFYETNYVEAKINEILDLMQNAKNLKESREFAKNNAFKYVGFGPGINFKLYHELSSTQAANYTRTKLEEKANSSDEVVEPLNDKEVNSVQYPTAQHSMGFSTVPFYYQFIDPGRYSYFHNIRRGRRLNYYSHLETIWELQEPEYEDQDHVALKDDEMVLTDEDIEFIARTYLINPPQNCYNDFGFGNQRI